MAEEEGAGLREEAGERGLGAESLEGWQRWTPRWHRSPGLGGCTLHPEGRGEEASWGPSPRMTLEGEKRRDRARRAESTGICKAEGGYRAGPRAPTLTNSGRREAGRSLRTESEPGGLWRARPGATEGRRGGGEEEEKEVRNRTEENRGEGKGGRQREEERMGKSENGKQKEGRRESAGEGERVPQRGGGWDTEGTRGRRK